MSIKIIQYNKNLKFDWDNFLKLSKYHHFFFKRDFIDYNTKLNDFSLMFYKKNKLFALMPANIDKKGKILSTHDGLSFAGLIKSKDCKLFDQIEIFEELLSFATKKGINKINYKLIPFIYSNNNSEEDKFLLNFLGFKLSKCEISSYINTCSQKIFSERKKRNIKKFIKNKKNFFISTSTEYLPDYWHVLENLLGSFKTKPTHNLEQISSLVKNFPENIKSYNIINNDTLRVLSGIILFINEDVVHTQYIASTSEGKKICSNDYLISYLIEKYKEKKYFSIGRSTDTNFAYNINNGLLKSKEEFGSEYHTLETYSLNL